MYLIFDCETGGVKPEETSLLTASFMVCEKNWDIIDTLDLYFKPEDGIYHIQAKALEINKIDLVEHDKVAISSEDNEEILANFFRKNNYNAEVFESAESFSNNDKVIPVGWNVQFDIDWLNFEMGWFKDAISYHIYDLKTINMYLARLGHSVNGNLMNVALHHKLYNGNEHTAKGDVGMCRGLAQRFDSFQFPLKNEHMVCEQTWSEAMETSRKIREEQKLLEERMSAIREPDVLIKKFGGA